ncbi:hypothetical protein IPJ91_01685 [bacterium]|nr:MAG: hypothetical protein IPJ91_01685 [bacterium]
MPNEIQMSLVNLGRIIFYVATLIFTIVALSLLLDKVMHKDYSDQTGVKNFRQYGLGLSLVFLVLLILGYALFFALVV